MKENNDGNQEPTRQGMACHQGGCNETHQEVQSLTAIVDPTMLLDPSTDPKMESVSLVG